MTGEGHRRHIPLFVDLSSRAVVIFGGGKVAERKARFFSPYAEVKVVSKSFTRGLEDMGLRGEIKLIQADLSFGYGEYLQDAFIVVPATDDHQLNQKIASQASLLGALVNMVDGIGEVVVPSIIRQEPVTLAISSLGASPALSKYLRLKLERELDQRYSIMARLLGEIREELKRSIPHQASRKELFWRILQDPKVWDLLEDSYEKAYMRARELVLQDERDSLDAGYPQESQGQRD